MFIEGGYEKHDEDASIGDRLNLGVAFRFSLPDFKGRSYAGGSMTSDLYRIVEREKRILYEEREADGIVLSASGEGSTRNVSVQLRKAATEDVVLNFIGTASSATYGTDWMMSVDGTACTAVDGTDCSVTVMAGETVADDEVVITIEEPERGEPAKEIILSVEVTSGGGTDLTLADPLVVPVPAGAPLPNVFLSATSTEITEGGMVTLTLNLSEMLEADATFNLISGGNATYGTSNDWNLSVDGNDCASATEDSPCPVTISRGDTTAAVSVAVNTDTDNESSSETFTVSVEVASGSASIVQEGNTSSLTFTIPADPPLPTVSLSASTNSITEGNTGTITLTLSQALGSNATFNLIEGGTGATYGTSSSSDWNLSIGGTDCNTATRSNLCQVTISQNDTSAEVTVEINADSTSETIPETFTVSVVVDSGSTHLVQEGSPSSLTFTIPADPSVSISADNTNIAEGESAILTVTLSEAVDENVVINLLEGGAADYGTGMDWHLNNGSDCSTATGTSCQITITAGQTSATATVNVNTDTTFEGSEERFTVEIDIASAGMTGVIEGSPSSLNFTIPADTATLGFASTGITTDETRGNQSVRLIFVLKDASGMKLSSLPVALPFTLSITNNDSGDINIDTDPGLEFDPSSVSFNSDDEIENSFSFSIVDDKDTEPREEFVITLGEGPNFPSGWSIDPNANTFTITINANDQPTAGWVDSTGEVTTSSTPVLYNAMVSISESPSSTITFQATVTGGTRGNAGDFVFDGANGCDNIVFSPSDTGNDLTKSCGIRVFSRAAGKTLTMTLVGFSAAQDYTINRATHMVTVNAP